MKKKYKTMLLSVVLGVSVLVALTISIWWKPIAIKYHEYRVNALLDAKPEFDPSSGLFFFDEEWGDAFEKHRDKLVRLGYLQRKEFRLSTIKTPSLRFRRLWEELQARFPDNPYSIGLGYDSNSPATIVVFAKPEKLHEWEKIILAHDAPASNILDVAEQEDIRELLPFVGRWANDRGQISYIITKDPEGNFRLESPPNKVWRSVLRNVRLEGAKIIFDHFSYTDPNEGYKSIIDHSSEHVFSGVRCETVLEVNPNDSNELFQSGTAASKYGIYADPNVYISRRVK